MAILIIYLQDTDKLHNIVSNILRPCLNDPSDDIVSTTQDGILLCVAFRLAMADLNHVFQSTTMELIDNCQMFDIPTDKKNVTNQCQNSTLMQGSHSDSSETPFSDGLVVILMQKLKTCHYLLPFVISSVIKSAPFYEETTKESISCTNTLDDTDVGNSRICLANIDQILNLLFESKQIATENVEKLHEYLSREWYEPWFQLNWISDILLVSMTESSSHIPVPTELCPHPVHILHEQEENEQSSLSYDHVCLDNLVLTYISFFRDLTCALGQEHTQKFVISKFESKLPMLSISSEEGNKNNVEFQANEVGSAIYSSSILPIYALGILCNFQTGSELSNTIRRWSTICCLQGLSTQPIVFSIHYILKIERSKNRTDEKDEWYSEVRDALSEMAWSLLVHSNAKVRIFSGVVLDLLASCGTY